MKRCIVGFVGQDGYVNMPADRLKKDESFIYAYSGEELVGAFDLGTINYIYLSEKNPANEARK